MSYTFEQFVADSHDALKRNSGPEGREQVRQDLERLLSEPTFIAELQKGDPDAPATLLYKDEELGFLILSHVRQKNAAPHAPHNHGNSWAIYGQVLLHTDVTEWERVDNGGSRAELKPIKQYRLLPGQAGIYQAGAIHSVSSSEGARIIRITGTDLDTIDRERFDLDTGTVTNLKKAN